MKETPYIIDGLAHLRDGGLWIDGKTDCSEITLLRQMNESEVAKSIITALPGVISNEEVLKAYRKHPDRFIPFACPTGSIDSDFLRHAKNDGFAGVKLHPRLGQFQLDEPWVTHLVRQAVDCDLPVMLCSVTASRFLSSKIPPHAQLGIWADVYPLHTFILAHAGGHHLLDAWHMARVRENVYLDLSHTLHYYKGSSIEKDIGFVARRLDQRVLFGSDFPECSISEALVHLDRHLESWPKADRSGILGRNWERILKKHGWS